MAAAVKAAAIAAMIRVFGIALGGDVMPFGTLGWASPMVVIAAITITIGNITAVRQDNIKRMLAYSSISHAGVLLVGICAMGLGSPTAHVGDRLLPDRVLRSRRWARSRSSRTSASRGRERLLVDDWAGLAHAAPRRRARDDDAACCRSAACRRPAASSASSTSSSRAMDVYDGQLLWLVIVGVINSAISIYYYLRIVTAMYFREANQPFAPTRSPGLLFVIALMPILVLELGLMPGWWLRLIG